jgi:hypothetical protein
MARSVRRVIVLGSALALLLATVTSASAGGRKVLDSTMTGLPVILTELNGLTGGGAPWQIDNGRALLFADGRLHLEVEGLIIPALGRNPVSMGKAIVTCGEAFAAESALVPFSEAGDATVDAVLDLPSPCQAPAVFFTNATNRWFAVTGF